MQAQHDLIISEATRRNYRIVSLSNIMDTNATEIWHNGKTELIINGTPTSLINLRALQYFDNKLLTKKALEKLDIPYPRSMFFSQPSEALSALFQPGKRYICKPVDMTEGLGVELNIYNYNDVQNYWDNHRSLSTGFMIEEYIEGDDLRIQVIGGHIVAACKRIPASITGDGVQDVESLIQERRFRVQEQNSANDLKVDKHTTELLVRQGVRLNEVLEKNRTVRLKELANMSQGAEAVDVTTKIHADFQIWVDKLVDYFRTDYFAIDVISTNIAETPDNYAQLLEINAKPEWLHHTFSSGKQHDIAALLLDYLFEN